MKIIEQFIEAKTGNPADCEDGIFISKDFVAVIDGVTSKGKHLWGDTKVKSGVHAKDTIMNALTKMPYHFTGEQAIQYLTEQLKKEYSGSIPEDIKERLQAVIIIFSAHRKEVWLYGDCQCIVNKKHYYKEMSIDIITTSARSLYLHMLLQEGKSINELLQNDYGRQYILPLLEKQAIFANSDHEFGYAVLDGCKFNLKLFTKIKVKSGDKIIFASDGYPKLFETLAETEKSLKAVLKADPLLINDHKGFKALVPGYVSFDDRSYISFLVN